jgi:hypothetical protein
MKTLVISVDVVDEKYNSVFGEKSNAIFIPMAVDELDELDPTRILMSMAALIGQLPTKSSIIHLLPRRPYGKSWEPDSKIDDMHYPIFFEYAIGSTQVSYTQKGE